MPALRSDKGRGHAPRDLASGIWEWSGEGIHPGPSDTKSLRWASLVRCRARFSRNKPGAPLDFFMAAQKSPAPGGPPPHRLMGGDMCPKLTRVPRFSLSAFGLLSAPISLGPPKPSVASDTLTNAGTAAVLSVERVQGLCMAPLRGSVSFSAVLSV